MVSINVDLSLSDISSVIQFVGSSEAERREVLDFVLGVDSGMCDVHWSLDLIRELATSVAQETIDGDWRKISIPVSMNKQYSKHTMVSTVVIPIPNLARALAAIDPETAVQIYAESQELRKQELAKIEQAKAQTRCAGCGHTYSEHSGTCLAEEPGLGSAFTWQCECREFTDRDKEE